MNINGKIWRDQNGVCHVKGKDKVEVFGLMGYAHGRDRGMQVLLMRILGRGRAAEILDANDEIVAIDKFFRRMNWAGKTDEQVEMLSGEAKAIIDAYVNGLNQAFSEKTPWEFKLFGYKPEPWQAGDCILISRMIGYLTLAQSQGEMERLFIEMAQAGVDEERLQELFPGILGGMDLALIKKISLQERLVDPASLWHIAPPVMMASNNWAVSGTKTASGSPMLANDPHLEINRLPNVWYEMVLNTDDTYAMGGTMPGFPALLVGRNPYLSWGATYTFMDGTDSWIEHCRDGKYRAGDDTWHFFTKREEIIHRKKKTPLQVVFYENHRGVLAGDPHIEGYYLTTAWAPSVSGAATLESILGIFDAISVEQAMPLASRIETSWNFVLADTDGNIGYQMTGLMPKRRAGVSGFVPLPGWEEENDWQGFEAPEDLPRCLNPACGYFVTSNQNLNEYGRVNAINVGMGPYRSDRIRRVLAEKNDWAREDMARLHYDVYSTQAEAFMKILGPLLSDTGTEGILKHWDCEYGPDSRGAPLFDRFYRELHRQIFGVRGFGEAAFDHLAAHTGMLNDFYINFDRILLSEESIWFAGKKRADLYRGAADIALTDNPEKWGDNRKVILKNILFDGKLPRFLGFDRGPVTIIGSLATPHQGQIFESAGRLTTFAPSFRMITDMATDDIYTNMAGGPSDRRFSRWYCPDLESWKTGVYKKLVPHARKVHEFK